MANFTNTLYPPQVGTFQPAFDRNKEAVIYFSLSPYNDLSETEKSQARVHVTVKKQSNNENVLKLEDYPLGIKIRTLEYNPVKSLYQVTISASDLQGDGFEINEFYKVQLRLDKNSGNKPIQPATQTEYIYDNIQDFSEWSSVCLLRPIDTPVVELRTFEVDDNDNIPKFHQGILPVIGKMFFGDKDSTETETLQSYQLFIVNKIDQDIVLAESPIVYTGDNINPNDINYRFDIQQNPEIIEGNTYTLIIQAITRNQFRYTKSWDFGITSFANQESFHPTFTMTCDNENGIVKLELVQKRDLPQGGGTLYIKRSSNYTNYKVWEDVRVLNIGSAFDYTDKGEGAIYDNTVGSRAWYMYSVQFENAKGALTHVVYAKVPDPNIDQSLWPSKICPDFDNVIITRNTKNENPLTANNLHQFKLKYDYSISSMKPVVNRAKIDTLGGKYPKFAENAILNYKQFSISGLLTATSDMEEYLITQKGYFGDDYDAYLTENQVDSKIVKTKTGSDKIYRNWAYLPKGSNEQNNTGVYVTKDAHDGTDFWWEREFREAAIKWLNDGEPKLYRSLTEGNLAVMITDISLTPNRTLGRRIWNFSATMYEVGDGNSLDDLDRLGIYHVTKQDPLEDTGDGEAFDPSTPVSLPGQLYTMEVTDTDGVVSGLISQTLQERYGGVQRAKLPTSAILRSVKITFHSKPNIYIERASGLTEVYNYNGLTAAERKKAQLGYAFQVKIGDKFTKIFVNERGYYQLPNKLKVADISFLHIGDIVTIEYVIDFKEEGNSDLLVSGSDVEKWVIGQQQQIFKPDMYVGTTIRRKYNFVKTGSYKEYMPSWTGICVDVEPFAVCTVQYEKETSAAASIYDLLVGQTGVLHFLKNMPMYDLAFKGRRMIEVLPDGDTQEEKIDSWLAKVRFLEEWEYMMDPTDQIYANTNDVPYKFLNTVYKIGDDSKYSLKIFYRQQWYSFTKNYKMNSLTKGDAEQASEAKVIDLARVPVEGQLNYYAQIRRDDM